MRFAWAGIVAWALIGGCTDSTPLPQPVYPDHPDPKFRAALPFRVDGVLYEGTALLPRRSAGTKIEVVLPKETQFLFFNTCAREDPVVEPKVSTYVYDFVPAWDKENMGSCALLITAVTRAGEFHRSVIDFTNSKGRDLKGKLYCNGKWLDVDGAAFCQTRAGIPTGVKFDTDVIAADPDECAALKVIKPKREFEVDTEKGLCGYDFMDQGRNILRLSTLGYTSVLNVFPPTK